MSDSTAWHSVHVFLSDAARQETFLVRVVAPRVKDIFRNGFADGWFFIRYWEGGPHVRVRLRSSEDAFKNFRDTISREADGFKTDRAFSAAEFYGLLPQTTKRDAHTFPWYDEGSAIELPYDREIQRYGGQPALLVSEELFRVSSEVVIRIIGESMDLSQRMSIAFDFMLANALVLFESRSAVRDYFSRYATLWKDFVTVTNEERTGGQISHLDAVRIISRYDTLVAARKQADASTLLGYWIQQLETTKGKLEHLAKSGELLAPETNVAATSHSERFNAISSIFVSQMHMFNNRLGITPSIEFNLARLACRCL